MKITKSGFYKLSEIGEEFLEIEKNISVSFFDDGEFNKKIFVSEKSELHICGFLEKEDNYSLEVFQKGQKSKVFINYLLFSKDNDKIKAKIYSKIQSNFSESYINIVSLAGDSGKIDLDGVLEFEKRFIKMKGKLEEENIFLGKNSKIRGIPTLLVRSNDVKASHSCKIHKINDENLFYLRSRGMGRDDSVFMLIQAKIQVIFGKLREFDLEFFTKICRNILFK